MNTKDKPLIFKQYDDPDFSWIKVSFTTLRILGIEGNITEKSLHDGRTVYLNLTRDANSDANIFLRTLAANGLDYVLKHKADFRKSKIRNYPPYKLAYMMNH